MKRSVGQVALGCMLALFAWQVRAASPPAAPTPEAPQMLLEQAWYLEHGLRDLPKAIRAYQQIVERFADVPEVAAKAQLSTVDCLERLGKMAEAKKALVQAHELFPMELKKYPARLELLEGVRQRFDEGLNADLGLSDTKLVREMLDMIPLNEASKICETYYQNALQERVDKPQQAILSLRKTVLIGMYLGLTERAAEAQIMIGDLYAELGKYPEALDAYRTTTREFPKETSLLAWTQMRLAETYRLMGELENAEAAYRAVPEQFADQPGPQAWALVWLGDLYRERNRPDDAKAAWREAVEKFGKAPAPLAAELAAYLLDEQAPPPKVSGKDAFANDVAYFLAVRFESLGKYTEAQGYYKQCMESSAHKDWPYELARRALAAR